MSNRKYRPVKLTPAQLKRCWARDGFRVRFPDGRYYYFLLINSGAIKIIHFNNLGVLQITRCILGLECVGRFFNVVLPHMRKLGWIPDGR